MCPFASKAEVRAAVENAIGAQPAWAATNPQRRARVLMKFLELVARDMEPLAELLAREHGKTITDAKGDIQRGAEVIEFAIGIPHLMKGEFTDSLGVGASRQRRIGRASGCFVGIRRSAIDGELRRHESLWPFQALQHSLHA